MFKEATLQSLEESFNIGSVLPVLDILDDELSPNREGHDQLDSSLQAGLEVARSASANSSWKIGLSECREMYHLWSHITELSFSVTSHAQTSLL